ncbi:uncharacterized protein EDB93DRAFT_445617 [Suillus bovinus]|uniref:uncharacterized protein n=1 Tax=Suillus bovinus TaxID=48563 RepID=UPI001B863A67|nr:uncharacterized protein EDB93DRAFT_445617 [Suillus bovinus]KAG2159125.1 hypothetical protein EDB93DRAFT_445617 [Suillus bovinus]
MLTCVRPLRRTPSSRSLLIISFMLAGIHILSLRSSAAIQILFLDVLFSRPLFSDEFKSSFKSVLGQTFLTCCISVLLEMTDTDAIDSAVPLDLRMVAPRRRLGNLMGHA